MVKLYKNWALEADEDKYYVGRMINGRMENPAAYESAVDAVKHIMEAEARKEVKGHNLLKCSEFLALYSDIADDLQEAILQAPCGLSRNVVMKYRPQGMETR